MDVKTAGRTVDLFEIFAKAKAPLTLSEVARELDAPQSSCFNLVHALKARGFLYSVGGNKRIYPTRKLFEIAEAIADYEPVVARLEPMLERLRDTTNETVILGRRQGDRVIYLAVAEGRQTIRYISRAGELKPMHSSAVGKALLMAMPGPERSQLAKRLPRRQITESTITRESDLLRDLEKAQKRGFSQTRGENVTDVMAIGFPFSVDGGSYAIAIAGPITRMAAKVNEHASMARAMLTKLD